MTAKRRKRKKKTGINYPLLGAGLLFIAVLTSLSIVYDMFSPTASSNAVGFIGVFLAMLCRFFFGQTKIIVPIILLFLGIYYLYMQKPLKMNLRFSGFLTAFTASAALFHFSSTAGSFKESIKMTLLIDGGGIYGAIWAFLIRMLFGEVGGYVLLGLALLFGILIMMSKNFWLMMRQLKLNTQRFFQARALLGREKRAERLELRKKDEEEQRALATAERKNAQKKLPEAKTSQVMLAQTNNIAHHSQIKKKKAWYKFFQHENLPEEEASNQEEAIENLRQDIWSSYKKKQLDLQSEDNEQLSSSQVVNDNAIAAETDLSALPKIAEQKSNQQQLKTEKLGHDEQKITGEVNSFVPPIYNPDAKPVYKLPSIELFTEGKKNQHNTIGVQEKAENIALLEEAFASFHIEVKVIEVAEGPSVTRYIAKIAPGVKVSSILNRQDDIALSLAATRVRIEAPIPGRAAIGIEVPNKKTSLVALREVFAADEFKNSKAKLAAVLGIDINGRSVVADIARMPHLLIAGSTGSGKSVCLNTIICSLLFRHKPDKLKLMMIDPKMVELSGYNGIPHLICPVVTDPKKAAIFLKWMVSEMEDRYARFAASGVKDLVGYNRRMFTQGGEELPQIVIIIDELADLMMVASRDVEDCITRIAQLARAAGMHMIIATQRPSVDVITGTIKNNIPARIAFAVSSQVDSRTVLDRAGAEKLLGMGDMLFCPINGSDPQRVQGAFVSEEDVVALVTYLKSQGKPEYLEPVFKEKVESSETEAAREENEDDMLGQAVWLVLEGGQASISMLQRRLRVGYNRAARLIDLMEEKGYVGGYEGAKARRVIITKNEYEDIFGMLS